MQKKNFKKIIISIAVIAISLLLQTKNSSAAAWNNHNLTIIYGENTTSIDISSHVDNQLSGTHVGDHTATSCVDYTINNCNTGSKTITGYSSYYVTVNPLAVGSQEITVTTKSSAACLQSSWGPCTTVLNISCEYSQSLQNVVKKLGGTMNNYTYSTTNMFSNVAASNVEAIYEAKSMYEALTSNEQKLVDSLINSKGVYATYSALYNGAEEYITNLATAFRNESLKRTDNWNIKATPANYKTIKDAATAYNNLTVRVQNKVNSLLNAATSAATPSYPSLLNDAKAIEFIYTNKINTPVVDLTKEIDETILNSKTAWNDLSAEVQNRVNNWLKANNDNGDKTYAEWMETVQNNLDQRNAEIFTSTYNLKDFDENNMSEDIANKIVNEIASEYNKLNENTQKKADTIIGMNFKTLKADAQYYLDDLAAEKFVTENKLNDTMTEQLAHNILSLSDDFDALKDQVKNLVLKKIRKNDFDELMEIAQDYLNYSEAMKFYENYIEGLDSTKIVAGEEAWNNANDEVQTIIDESLKANGVDKTYPELLENAKLELNNIAAENFINTYLTLDDGTVISEANNSNYKKIINAEEYYNLLTEEVKALVNEKLQKVSNTTYPELLTNAKNIVKTPKTGDVKTIVAIVLVISILGLIYVKRK